MNNDCFLVLFHEMNPAAPEFMPYFEKAGEKFGLRCVTEKTVTDKDNILFVQDRSSRKYEGHKNFLRYPIFNPFDAREKWSSKENQTRLVDYGIPMPKTTVITRYDESQINSLFDDLVKEFGKPFVFKKSLSSRGEGVDLVFNSEQFGTYWRNDYTVVQQYIAESRGTDIRLYCVGGKIVGAMKRTNKGSFKSNLARGGVGEAYPVDEKLEDIARRVYDITHLEIIGIDCLIQGDSYLVCEINSNPGVVGINKALGINVTEDVVRHCLERIKNG